MFECQTQTEYCVQRGAYKNQECPDKLEGRSYQIHHQVEPGLPVQERKKKQN